MNYFFFPFLPVSIPKVTNLIKPIFTMYILPCYTEDLVMCKKKEPTRLLENYSWNILLLHESPSFVRDLVLFSDVESHRNKLWSVISVKSCIIRNFHNPWQKKIIYNCLLRKMPSTSWDWKHIRSGTRS